MSHHCIRSVESADRVAASPEATTSPAIVALIGNPNTGKTTLFNALTGYRRKVANYPGVTVDVGRGRIRGVRRPVELLDLPGTYSLAAVSPDEMVVVSALCCRLDPRRCPDAILAIADASNLARNLYLVSQLLEFDLPVVLALNMVDVARKRGIEIDTDELSRRLGIPVIPIVATERDTLAPLLAALERAIGGPAPARGATLPAPLVEEAERLSSAGTPLRRAEALRVLLDRHGQAEHDFVARGGSRTQIEQARERLAAAGLDDPAVEVRARYAWINQLLDGVIRRSEPGRASWSDRLDRVLTHKVGGAAFLLGVLYVVFQSIFYWAGPLMRGIEGVMAWLGEVVSHYLPAGAVQSLLVDGVIGGVGSVLVFLPQIVLLFAFIAVLEDCGYLARAAFMVDRLMRAIGLSGRAFIPLLSSFACAVPAIMSTRTIADRRERHVTILLAPLMSCSARLPVYLVFIGALVPDLRYWGGLVRVPALVMLGMYLIGVLVAIPIGWLLRKTAFAGPPSGFLLELPGYRRPRLGAVAQRVYLSGKDFIVRAGTIILLVNLLVWALAYFPHSQATRDRVEQERHAAGWDEAEFERRLAGAYLRDSYLGRMGRAMEPAIAPLGWDWRIGVSIAASFPARELVVATLGTLFGLTEESGAGQFREALRQATWEGSSRPLFTLPVALSLMVFYALCAQCVSTLVVIGREMRSVLWPLISFTGMTTIAYFAAWGISAAARALGL